MTQIEPVYSTRQVAERLGVTVEWVRRTFSGRAGVIRLNGHNMRIPESVLLQVMRESGYQGGKDGKAREGKTGNRPDRGRDQVRP